MLNVSVAKTQYPPSVHLAKGKELSSLQQNMGVASPSNLTSWGLEVVFDSRKGNHKSFSHLEDKYRFPSLYCHALVPDFHLMIQFRVAKYNKRAGETKPTSSLEHARSHFMFTNFNHATITVVDLMLNKIHSS